RRAGGGGEAKRDKRQKAEMTAFLLAHIRFLERKGHGYTLHSGKSLKLIFSVFECASYHCLKQILCVKVRHMAIKEGIRTGGRSARVQESIHGAVRDLLREHERADLSVPLIATRAGVTPSTIYRRWGDLTTLLADAAVERLRPDPPIDCGNLRDDLLTWTEMYLDDVDSAPGREMMRDVIASGGAGCSGKCMAITRE